MKNTWKNIESKIAQFFNTERTPLSGGNSKHTRSDTLHKNLFIEVKYRKTHSAVALWRSILKKAQMEKKTPVVCLKEKHKPGFFIVCHSNDLTEISSYVKDKNIDDRIDNEITETSSIGFITSDYKYK